MKKIFSVFASVGMGLALSGDALADNCTAPLNDLLKAIDPAASVDHPASFDKNTEAYQPSGLISKSSGDNALDNITQLEADQRVVFSKKDEHQHEIVVGAILNKGKVVGYYYSAKHGAFAYPESFYSNGKPEGDDDRKWVFVTLDGDCKAAQASLDRYGVYFNLQVNVEGQECIDPAKSLAGPDPAELKRETDKYVKDQLDRYFNSKNQYVNGKEITRFEYDLIFIGGDPENAEEVAEFRTQQEKRQRRRFEKWEAERDEQDARVLEFRRELCQSLPKSQLPAPKPPAAQKATVAGASPKAGAKVPVSAKTPK